MCKRTHIDIKNCTFVNNKAKVPKTVSATSGPLRDRPFGYGRGGGLALMFEQTNIQLEILNCSFENNVADVLGGAIYLLNYNQIGCYVMRGNTFRDNSIHEKELPHGERPYISGGGAVFVGLVSTNKSLVRMGGKRQQADNNCTTLGHNSHDVLALVDNNFIRNKGNIGGGVYIEASGNTVYSVYICVTCVHM